MKVADLITRLKEFPAEAEVYLRHPSHDYWRTELAGEVDDVAYMDLEWSAYHRTNRIVRERDEDDDEEQANIKPRQVVIDMRTGW